MTRDTGTITRTNGKNKLEKRVYFLSMYNISSMQVGVQNVHSALEYAVKYKSDKEFMDFVKNHKTCIFLSGGTSGDMAEHWKTLNKIGIKCAKFHEPDLNNSLSSICFICDERVYDKHKYPDLDGMFPETPSEKEWLKSIGGKKNYELREFLRHFKLSNQ